eukprot:4577523-Amphidinium_carterae.1
MLAQAVTYSHPLLPKQSWPGELEPRCPLKLELFVKLAITSVVERVHENRIKVGVGLCACRQSRELCAGTEDIPQMCCL